MMPASTPNRPSSPSPDSGTYGQPSSYPSTPFGSLGLSASSITPPASLSRWESGTLLIHVAGVAPRTEVAVAPPRTAGHEGPARSMTGCPSCHQTVEIESRHQDYHGGQVVFVAITVAVVITTEEPM